MAIIEDLLESIRNALGGKGFPYATKIKIESWSNAERTLYLRGYTDEGLITLDHKTNADRSLASETLEIKGYPRFISIKPSAIPVRRGECYVRITLILGDPAQEVARLSAGYLTDGKNITWPPGVFEGFTEGPGLIKTIAGTNPATNTEVSETVPTNVKWRILGLSVILTTDANAANRFSRLIIDDGTTTLFVSPAATALTASSSQTYNWKSDLPVMEDTTYAQLVWLPKDLDLFQGWRLRTTTGGLQAGDDYGVPTLYVEEWIQE